jgi:hypothetical protein
VPSRYRSAITSLAGQAWDKAICLAEGFDGKEEFDHETS